MRMVISLLVLLLSSTLFAQIDSVFAKNGEVYIGKVRQANGFIEIITQADAIINIKNDNVFRIGYSKRVEPQLTNSFRNPDGENVSIHVTPYYSGGTYYQSIGTLTNSIDYKNTINLSLRIKVPVGNWTFSPFYETGSREMYHDEVDLLEKSSFYNAGLTVSIYIK